jgi:hypothetical protein
MSLIELVSAFNLQHSYSGEVRGRSYECYCRSIMLRQEQLAFIKAISTLHLSLALLNEFRLVISRMKKKPAVPTGSRSTSGSGVRAAQRPSSQLAGKRKANELTSSGNSMEPANINPARGVGSAPLPSNSSVTGEKASVGSRQPGPFGEGRRKLKYWMGPSPRLSQVGQSSPQLWIRTRPNPVSQRRQPIGACLAKCQR